jgi:ATP-dependent DNA ligase
MGRGTFDKLVSTIQKKGSDWSGVAFMVFDLADIGSFEDRECVLRKAWLPSHAKPVAHKPLTGHQELSEMEADIVANGGEGCVIRRPGSQYRPGRMGDTIKVKRLVADIDRWQG